MAEAARLLIKNTDQKVLKFICNQGLIEKGDRILTALSGGPDSVFALCFLHKFQKRLGITLAAAHINHSLRGAVSDEEENFCKELSKAKNVEYFAHRADVRASAEERKVSVEEAARDIRYSFLEQTASANSYDKIVTAHNLSDNAETVLLNLIKGSGIKGLSGIPVCRGNIIRPFLCLSKKEITGYLVASGIEFRIDASNNDSLYERNFLRNEILPAIKEKLSPAVEENIFHFSEILRDSGKLLEQYSRQLQEKIYVSFNGHILINLEMLKKAGPAALGITLKNVFFTAFNAEFKYSDLEKVKNLINLQAGRQVELSGGIRAHREREGILLIKQCSADASVEKEIRAGEEIEFEGKKLRITLKDISQCTLTSDQCCEYIASEGLSEQFILRRWRRGDKFMPLGMKNFRKVSDFLTDKKLPVLEKQRQLVLLNGEKIVWLPGLRIDERVKLTGINKRVYELCLE